MTTTPARTDRPRTNARRIRDLFVVLIGIGLMVLYFVLPQPRYYTKHSDPSTGFEAAFLLSFAFIVVGLAMFVGHARPLKRPRPRGRRWVFSLLGLVLGGYLTLAALVSTGIIGQHASTGDLLRCHPLREQREHSNWFACDMGVRWPDGTTGVVANVPQAQADKTVEVVRPAFTAWPFPGAPHKFQLVDLVCILAVGIPLLLQALFSLAVLAGSGLGSRRHAREYAGLPGKSG